MPIGGLSLGEGMSLGGGIGIGTLVGHVVADISKWTGGLAKAATHLKGFSARMDGFLKRNANAMRRMGMRAAVVGAAVVAGIGAMTKSYGEFERRMRRATAVSEVTDKQFQEMSKMAEAASVRLNIAATSAADAFYYLGSAGLTAAEQMEAFPAIATLSKAAVIDMDHAAEMMVDTIKAYQKSFADTAEVSDIFTEAVTSSNMTFSHLGETMSLVGAIGRRTGNTIAELTAMIGLMANTGIKGSRAGTSLRRALLNLAAPSSEVREELAKWGVTVYNAEGKMKSFIQIIGEFGDALKDATEEQKNLAFKTLFGVRAITGQLAIFDLGVEKVQAYIDQLNNAGKATERVARKQMRAFLEQIGRVSQEVKRLARHLGSTLEPVIRDLADQLKPLINDMIRWVDVNKEMTTAIIATAAAMGTVLLISGTLAIVLAGLTIAAIGLGVSVATLAIAIGATTLGIGVLTASVVYITARIMKMKRRVRELKEEIEFKNQIRELTKLISKLEELVVAPGPMNQLLGQLIGIKGGFEELQEARRKALTATREELIEMIKDFGYEVPKGLGFLPKATSVLRDYVLDVLEDSTAAITHMAEEAAEQVRTLTKKVGDDASKSVRRQLTVFEMAWKRRKTLRDLEYGELREQYGAIEKDWSYLELKRVEATVEAIDDIQDAMADFFEETIMDAKNWKDALINFMTDIRRAMLRVFTTTLAEQIMGTRFAGSVLGGLFGKKGGGVAPITPTAPITPAVGSTTVGEFGATAFQHGGIVRRPTFGLIGERGREAVVPLSGGRTIPVDLKGAMPSVEVNVINKTSKPVDAQRGTSHFDGGKFVTEVVLKDVAQYGPIRKAIAGL